MAYDDNIQKLKDLATEIEVKGQQINDLDDLIASKKSVSNALDDKERVRKAVEKPEEIKVFYTAEDFAAFDKEVKGILKAKNDFIKKSAKLKDLPRYPAVAQYEGIYKRKYTKGLGTTMKIIQKRYKEMLEENATHAKPIK